MKAPPTASIFVVLPAAITPAIAALASAGITAEAYGCLIKAEALDRPAIRAALALAGVELFGKTINTADF